MNPDNTARRILVIDDDPIIRDMMVDILDFEGLPVRTARNGKEALQILHGQEPYLVFLDLLMPGMSGAEVCARLNADPALRSRHIIVLMSALDHLSESAALNVDAAIPKPFAVDDVMNIMNRYMRL